MVSHIVKSPNYCDSLGFLLKFNQLNYNKLVIWSCLLHGSSLKFNNSMALPSDNSLQIANLNAIFER